MTTTPIPSARPEPSMRLALWLAFGLGLATLALSTYALLKNKGSDILDFGGMLGVLLTVLSAPVIASAAAVLTARGLKKSLGARPIHYYVFRAFRLFRYLLTVDIALMPVIVLDGLNIMLKVSVIFGTLAMCYDEPKCIPLTPTLPDNVVGQTMS